MSRESLERLQVSIPDNFLIIFLRTLQRRLKTWRKERPHAFVFGAMNRADS